MSTVSAPKQYFFVHQSGKEIILGIHKAISKAMYTEVVGGGRLVKRDEYLPIAKYAAGFQMTPKLETNIYSGIEGGEGQIIGHLQVGQIVIAEGSVLGAVGAASLVVRTNQCAQRSFHANPYGFVVMKNMAYVPSDLGNKTEQGSLRSSIAPTQESTEKMRELNRCSASIERANLLKSKLNASFSSVLTCNIHNWLRTLVAAEGLINEFEKEVEPILGGPPLNHDEFKAWQEAYWVSQSLKSSVKRKQGRMWSDIDAQREERVTQEREQPQKTVEREESTNREREATEREERAEREREAAERAAEEQAECKRRERAERREANQSRLNALIRERDAAQRDVDALVSDNGSGSTTYSRADLDRINSEIRGLTEDDGDGEKGCVIA